MAFSVEYVYHILDKYSGPLDRISKKTQRFQAIATKTGHKINKMAGRMDKFANRAANLQNVIGAAAVTGSMFLFAKSASTLDDAMSDVSRVTGLTDEKLLRMKNRLQELGRQTGRSAVGLAAMAYEGGKLGIANEKMEQFVSIVMKTATAFDMVDSEAGRSIGSIRAKLGMTVESVDTLLQRVNWLADNTSATGNKMINIIERTSGTMKMLNIPAEVTAGWAAFADQVEVTPELAASGINMMMRRMMKMPGMMDKMLKDPRNAVINMMKQLSKLPEAERGVKILRLFGDEAGRFVMKTVGNMDLLAKTMQTAGSPKALGSMDREFSNIMARTSTAAKRVKETFIDIGRAIGTLVLKTFDKYSARILKATEWMLNFVKAHPVLVRTTMLVLALVAGFVAFIIPVGLLVGAIAALLPVLSAIAIGIGAVSAPVLIAIAVGALLITMFVAMYAKSNNFRMAITNLVEAFYPLLRVGKRFAMFLGGVFGVELSRSGDDLKNWGDVFATVLNFIAGMIATLTTGFERLLGITGKVLSGDLKGAWALAKEPLPEIGSLQTGGASGSKQQNQQVDISGQINVSGQNGAVVESAEIGLPTGANLAMSH